MNRPARHVEIEKLLYSVEDAAFALSLSPRVIRYMIGRKELQVRKIGARKLIPAAEVRRFSRQDFHGSLTDQPSTRQAAAIHVVKS
jgi:hypothetical protein